MDHRASRSRRDPAVLALLVLGVLASGAILAVRPTGQTPDALAYMTAATTAREMFHPHHLLYVPIVRLLLRGMQALGLAADAVLAAQVHNTLLAVAASVLTFGIVRRWGATRSGAAITAVALLACRGFLEYATQADVYVPATACLAGVALLLPRDGENPLDRKTPGILLLFALGVLYHQTNVLLALPLASWYASLRRRRAWAALGIVVLGAGIVVGSCYVAAYRFSDARAAMSELGVAPGGPVEGFLRFCLAYEFHPNPDWGTLRNFSPLGVGRLVHSQARNVLFFPEGLRLAATLGFALVGLPFLAWHAIRAGRSRALRRERVFLLLWIGTYGLFFLWWLPQEYEFFITTLLPLVLLAWITSRDLPAKSRPTSRVAAIAVVAVVAVANVSGAVMPARRDPGPAFVEAADIAALADPSCTVLHTYPVNQNLRYHHGFADVLEIDLPLLYALDGKAPPARFRLAGRECVLVPADYLRPDRAHEGMDGFARPAQWRAFLVWVLEAQRQAKGWTHREATRVADRRGRLYLRLGDRVATADSLEHVLARTDSVLSGAGGTPGPLVRWQRSTANRPQGVDPR